MGGGYLAAFLQNGILSLLVKHIVSDGCLTTWTGSESLPSIRIQQDFSFKPQLRRGQRKPSSQESHHAEESRNQRSMEIQVLGDFIKHDYISVSVSSPAHFFSQHLCFIFRASWARTTCSLLPTSQGTLSNAEGRLCKKRGRVGLHLTKNAKKNRNASVAG